MENLMEFAKKYERIEWLLEAMENSESYEDLFLRYMSLFDILCFASEIKLIDVSQRDVMLDEAYHYFLSLRSMVLETEQILEDEHNKNISISHNQSYAKFTNCS